MDHDADFCPMCEAMQLLEEKWMLHIVLGRLATLSPRQAMLVEQRFFGGLEMDDVARSLGISEATAYREWRAARAWLGRELGQDRQGKP